MEDQSAEPEWNRLLDLLRSATRPESPADLFREATGFLIPGFRAFPAVTVVGARPAHTKGKPDQLGPGDLLAFTTMGDSAQQRLKQLIFMTPVQSQTIWPVDVIAIKTNDPRERRLRIDSVADWPGMKLTFAVFPWRSESVSATECLALTQEFANTPHWLMGRLAVSARAGGRQMPLRVHWGVDHWLPRPSTESLLFPLNYARAILAPFVFSLSVDEEVMSRKAREDLRHQRSLDVSFRMSTDYLSGRYRSVDPPVTVPVGYTLTGHAIPLMNVDLRAWEPGVSFADFVTSSGLQPLGFAGLSRFKGAGNHESSESLVDLDLDPCLPYSLHLSLNYETDGRVTSSVSSFGAGPAGSDRQLLYWMTHGEAINGSVLRYAKSGQIQPLQKLLPSLQGSVAGTPCFGGRSMSVAVGGDLYQGIELSLAYPSQRLLSRDMLSGLIGHFIRQLGYSDCEIAEPTTEVRLVDGQRQRVTVVYLRTQPRHPIRPDHLRCVQSCLTQMSPIGSLIAVEEVRG